MSASLLWYCTNSYLLIPWRFAQDQDADQNQVAYSALALGLENYVRGNCAADFNEGASSNWVKARASRRRSQVQIPTNNHLDSLLLKDVPSLLQSNSLQELILPSRHDSQKQLCLFNICKWLKCPDLPCLKQSYLPSLRLFAFRGWSHSTDAHEQWMSLNFKARIELVRWTWGKLKIRRLHSPWPELQSWRTHLISTSWRRQTVLMFPLVRGLDLMSCK